MVRFKIGALSVLAMSLTACPLAFGQSKDTLAAQIAALQRENARLTTEKAVLIAEKAGLQQSINKPVSVGTAVPTPAQTKISADGKIVADEHAGEAKKDLGAVSSKIDTLQASVPKDNTALILAAIGLVGAFIAFLGLFVPVLLAYLKIREIAATRQAEHGVVLDKIALAEAEAHRATLATGSLKADIVQLETDRKETAQTQNAKLDQIHTLVNSKMTEAMQNELVALKANLASLLELAGVKQASGLLLAPETIEAIAESREQIAELEAQLKDRLKATAMGEKELAGQKVPQ